MAPGDTTLSPDPALHDLQGAAPSPARPPHTHGTESWARGWEKRFTERGVIEQQEAIFLRTVSSLQLVWRLSLTLVQRVYRWARPSELSERDTALPPTCQQCLFCPFLS